MAAVPLSPFSDDSPGTEVQYESTSPYLINGPKGFEEFKILDNDGIFVRRDFPGVPEEGVKVSLDQAKKTLSVYAQAPKVHKHDSSHRENLTVFQLFCRCCHFSTDFTSQMSHGVLRLNLTVTSVFPHYRSPARLPFGYFVFGKDFPHSGMLDNGRAYESKQLEDGSLYVRVDMPGVPKDNFTVSVASGIVKVTGQAPAVSHDIDGRFYSGDVAMLSAPVDVPSRRIKIIIKDGVIRLLIPPV